MKKMILSFMTILLIIFVVVNVQAENKQQAGNDLTGRYELPNGIIIRIYEEENKFYGEIVDVTAFNGGQTKDIKNPDKPKREDSLFGKIIVKNLEYDQESGQWINGEMYAPDRGMWANLKIMSVNRDQLVAEGSKFLFSKTVVWDKIY